MKITAGPAKLVSEEELATMKSIRAKKVAAAVAAVVQCVAEAGVPAPAAAEEPAPGTHQPSPAVWGLAGRQESMGYRSLWQRRLAKSW